MKFKSNEEGKCPICNSENLEYFGMEFDVMGNIYYPWHCPDCDTDGKEWYYVNYNDTGDNNGNVGTDEGKCPSCGAEIEYGTAEPDGNSLGYEYFCPECENSGTEWYDLDFDSHTIDGHEDEEIDVVKESKSVNDIETELNSKVAQYKKEETKDIWYSVELYGPSGNDRYDVTDTYKEAIASKKKGEKEYPNCRFEIVKMNGSIPTQKVNKKEINEGLEINKPQNKPVQAVEVTFKDKSMLFKTNQVSGVFVDARKFMIPFANELNLEVEDIKDINVNVIYEDGEKSSVRIKPFDYQDTAYERYKALGGTEVFGQFQDWYSFNGYDEYGNKVRRRKNSKLNGYANDGSQKRLPVENKKQEAVDDEEENDINFDDTISLLDIALSEIPTVGVEDWGKDDELLFTADTKVMFENLKNYEEEIPRYYYDNASNDDWSNGIDSYLEEIKGVNLNNGESDNTYNWNAPLTHDVEFTIYEADDGCYFKGSIHRAGDVRGNYTTEFLLKFNDKDDCLESLFDSCAGFCQREVKLENTTYVITPHFFNEYVDIYNLDTDEAYDDVYCDCIDRLKEIIAENKNSEE